MLNLYKNFNLKADDYGKVSKNVHLTVGRKGGEGPCPVRKHIVNFFALF